MCWMKRADLREQIFTVKCTCVSTLVLKLISTDILSLATMPMELARWFCRNSVISFELRDGRELIYGVLNFGIYMIIVFRYCVESMENLF